MAHKQVTAPPQTQETLTGLPIFIPAEQMKNLRAVAEERVKHTVGAEQEFWLSLATSARFYAESYEKLLAAKGLPG